MVSSFGEDLRVRYSVELSSNRQMCGELGVTANKLVLKWGYLNLLPSEASPL